VNERSTVHVIGFGNPGRLDDGLGPALADAIEAQSLPGVTVESDYQLTVEDAHEVAKHDVVVFADADVGGREPFYFRRLAVTGSNLLGSHGVAPGEVYGLAKLLFDAKTSAYILGIRGYEFNAFGERLSEKAKDNLIKATLFLTRVIDSTSFDDEAEPAEPAVAALDASEPDITRN